MDDRIKKFLSVKDALKKNQSTHAALQKKRNDVEAQKTGLFSEAAEAEKNLNKALIDYSSDVISAGELEAARQKKKLAEAEIENCVDLLRAIDSKLNSVKIDIDQGSVMYRGAETQAWQVVFEQLSIEVKEILFKSIGDKFLKLQIAHLEMGRRLSPADFLLTACVSVFPEHGVSGEEMIKIRGNLEKEFFNAAGTK
ncbi:MAG: hypothetical protein FD156_196 [Nitrospirae bacterium]|nr:MAG: hypothetical protein FD156_196 [Nitrospirota bacterium]